jgi:fructokinase
MAGMNANERKPLIVGLGEILWDLLPTGRVLGGAPGNVAVHASALGACGAIASCVGADDLGEEIRRHLRTAGLDITAIAIDPDKPTGTVTVELDDEGVPSFIIHQDVAWDAIPFTPELESLMARADAVCFGSLAQRSSVSQHTIREALAATTPDCLRICDVNLRQHYYSRDVLVESFNAADIVKLNDDELATIADLLSLPDEPDLTMRALKVRFDLQLAILTCGPEGSVLMTPDETSHHAGEPVEVVDTVGAGDAFTATVALGVLRGEKLSAIHERAERVARYVCTQPGATPTLPDEL